MKFAWKIFFTAFLIIVFTFGMGGFILINSVFQTSLNDRINAAVDNNRYLCTSLNTIINSSNAALTDYLILDFSAQISSQNGENVSYAGKKENTSFYSESSFVNTLKQNERGYKIVQDEDKFSVHVISRLYLNDRDIYVETLADITDIYLTRSNNVILYQILLLGVALFSSGILLLFSLYITKPLKKLSAMACRISGGDFDKRIDINSENMQTKEILSLSKDFNRMADYIENYIGEIKDEVTRRDDFVAAFTHELKTPLTSIIGYADMLRSYDLPSDQRRISAEYIYREGKRLEALSLHLLNMIVLKKNYFPFSEVSTDRLFSEIENSVSFLLKKYGIECHIQTEQGKILAEISLIKTLIYNLIDNACKASENGQYIELNGKIIQNRYRIEVCDFGHGIPEDEIERVTEPFYMVDKSRARKQGGAGLGLALCREIARIHDSELTISSKTGEGTTVSFDVEVCEHENQD